MRIEKISYWFIILTLFVTFILIFMFYLSPGVPFLGSPSTSAGAPDSIGIKDLTGDKRGFQETQKTWSAKINITRMFIAYDHNTLITNMDRINSNIVNQHDATVYTNGETVIALKRDGNVIRQGTAGSDDTAVMQAAIDYVNGLGGGEIYCMGSFSLSPLIGCSNLKITGKAIFNFSRMPEGVGISFNPSGYEHSTSSLASDAVEGTTSLTLIEGQGSKLAAGDWIKIVDDTTHDGGKFKNGELAEIESVTGDIITLTKPIGSPYSVSQNAYIRKILLFDNVSFEGITFTGPGMDTSKKSGISLGCVRNVRLINCNFNFWGTSAVSLRDCIDVVIDSCSFKDIYLDGLGYSIVIGNACEGIVISHCNFRGKGRHFIATGAGTGTYLSGGYFKDIKIHGCYFEASTQEAVNTHSACNRKSTLIVEDCIFINCNKGIEPTNVNLICTNNVFLNCRRSIDLIGISGETRSALISGNRFINTAGTENLSHGIVIQNYGNNVIISDNFFQSQSISCAGTGIFKIIVRGNTFTSTIAGINAVYIYGTPRDLIKDVIVENNRFDSWATGGGYTINLAHIDSAKIRNNTVKDSPGFIVATSTGVRVEDNYIKTTGKGCRFHSIAGNTFFLRNVIESASVGVYESGEPTGNLLIVDGNTMIFVNNPLSLTTLTVSSPYTSVPYVAI